MTKNNKTARKAQGVKVRQPTEQELYLSGETTRYSVWYAQIEPRRDVSLGHKTVARKIAALVNIDEGCRAFASAKYLGELLGCHERTIENAINALEAAGFLTVEQRGGGRRGDRGITRNFYLRLPNSEKIADLESKSAKIADLDETNSAKNDSLVCKKVGPTLHESTNNSVKIAEDSSRDTSTDQSKYESIYSEGEKNNEDFYLEGPPHFTDEELELLAEELKTAPELSETDLDDAIAYAAHLVSMDDATTSAAAVTTVALISLPPTEPDFNGKVHVVSAAQMEEYKNDFPDIDVLAVIKEADLAHAGRNLKNIELERYKYLRIAQERAAQSVSLIKAQQQKIERENENSGYGTRWW